MVIGVKKMKTNIWILLYLFLLLLIVAVEYQESDIPPQRISNHKYEIKENKALEGLFLEYIEPLDSNISLNKLWKILPPKVKKVKKIVVKDKNKTKRLKVTLKEKTICIEKKCFRLLGIFLDKQYASSFYVKDAKEKVQTFKVGERLSQGVQINKIEKNTIVFNEMNTTREWHIKLFDINSSKYKPKEFK
jgi:hypothetical protein